MFFFENATKEIIKNKPEDEKTSEWVNFFLKINPSFNPPSDNFEFPFCINELWLFDRKGNNNFKLLSTKIENKYVKRLLSFEIVCKKCVNTDPSLNAVVVLVSGDLSTKINEHYYYDYLISALNERNIFEINSVNGKFDVSNKKPLIIICNKAGSSNLLNNSSVWFKCIELEVIESEIKNVFENELKDISEDQKTKKINEEVSKKVKEAIECISKSATNYNDTNAKENLDYHLRLQAENILHKFGDGHLDIIPKLYSSETQCKQDILNINNTGYPDSHPEIREYNDAHFRILLIDDKCAVNTSEQNGEGSGKDKGFIISEIMKGVGMFEDEKYKEKLIWCENKIEYYLFANLDNTIKWCKEDNNQSNTQVIQVVNLTDAISLLANETIKFDLILLDYLLGKTRNGNRELATTFFEWLKDDANSKNSEALNSLKQRIYQDLNESISREEKDRKEYYKGIREENNKDIAALNRALKRKVLANRGPLKKLWIFPITAFNDTLIADLVNHDIRLIDYYWHISKGADPVTTPYLFLRQLNSFLYLQLENAVYTEEAIGNFLQRSISLLSQRDLKDGHSLRKLSNFSSFMASEYSFFIDQFMRRAEIRLDQNRSLFAKYIWDNFYTEPGTQVLFRLTQYIQKFYHRCAYGTEADYEKMILFYKELQAFIKHNRTTGGKDNSLQTNNWEFSLNPFYETLQTFKD